MRTSHPLSDASRRFSAKLAPRKDEPVEITKVLSPTVYDVETSDGRQLSKVHIKHLVPYRARQREDVSKPDNDSIQPITIPPQDDSARRDSGNGSSAPTGFRRRGRPRGKRTSTSGTGGSPSCPTSASTSATTSASPAVGSAAPGGSYTIGGRTLRPRKAP